MKKILIAGSLVFFLSIPKAQGSWFDNDVQDNAWGIESLEAAPRDENVMIGNYQHILDALDVAFSSFNQVFMDKKDVNIVTSRHSYLNPIGYIAPLQRNSQEALRKEVKLIKNFYADLLIEIKGEQKVQNIAIQAQQLEKDIDDLRDHKDKSGYFPKAKIQLDEYIRSAQVALNDMQRGSAKSFFASKIQEYTNILKAQPVQAVILQVHNLLIKAEEQNKEIEAAVYKKMIVWLKKIAADVKRFENAESDFEEAIKLVDEEIESGVKSPEDVQILTIVKVQLKLNAGKAEQKGTKELKEVKEIVERDNPRNLLKKAKITLSNLESKKNQRIKQGVNVKSKEILALEKEIKKEINYIAALEIRIVDLEDAADAKVADLLVKFDRDKNKALHGLLVEKGLAPNYFYSLWDNVSTLKDSISKMLDDSYENAVDKEAAQKLFAEIQSGSGKVMAQGSSQNFTGTPSTAQEWLSSKFGMNASIEKLPIHVRKSLKIMIEEAQAQAAKITENKRLSEAVKLEQKRKINNKLADDIATLCSPYYLGVGKAELMSGDPQTILTDLAINKLIQSGGL